MKAAAMLFHEVMGGFQLVAFGFKSWQVLR